VAAVVPAVELEKVAVEEPVEEARSIVVPELAAAVIPAVELEEVVAEAEEVVEKAEEVVEQAVAEESRQAKAIEVAVDEAVAEVVSQEIDAVIAEAVEEAVEEAVRRYRYVYSGRPAYRARHQY
jgi:transaldolase